ncbi:MAG TPA: rRNA maturation RNase YbeY [Thermoanaerobaculia bacterium]|nr:rRNA maturation RNase YbeY [Thermoanaerobaculia bacterium]
MNVEISGPAVPRFPRREMTAFVRKAVGAIERAGAAPFRPTEVAIAFVDDAAMAALNRRFRGRGGTTDVLSFPAGDDPEESDRRLGDIAISLDRARRQAREQHHSLATEVRYLILHGIIHAFGWDHESDEGEMNALEIRLRPKLGLIGDE